MIQGVEGAKASGGIGPVTQLNLSGAAAVKGDLESNLPKRSEVSGLEERLVQGLQRQEKARRRHLQPICRARGLGLV